ncbi:UPF0193 protein EVG1 homolog [Lutzomyia longipalpis]|uniref:UPF0193 protein EVG1 homolog n=1 Tax=Lutzomyia longipalpis TaxID=7200 RepID=UPI00248458EC|nr:UPF0193 protein EVG1 homolog [Lutzomyia longipalpis]
MEWPSKRIPPGGVFHPPKVKNYSKETQNLIKVLMDEAKLTMLQRKNINTYLRTGEPLPVPKEEQRPISIFGDPDQDAKAIIERARCARKRSLEIIKASGAFEKSRYIPKYPWKVPSETAKRRLQEVMSGLKYFPEPDAQAYKYRHRRKSPEIEERDQICELLCEIHERAEWLAEMEALGEGKKHRDVIHNQIAEKLRQIKILERRNHKRELEEHLENQLKQLSVKSTQDTTNTNSENISPSHHN